LGGGFAEASEGGKSKGSEDLDGLSWGRGKGYQAEGVGQRDRKYFIRMRKRRRGNRVGKSGGDHKKNRIITMKVREEAYIRAEGPQYVEMGSETTSGEEGAGALVSGDTSIEGYLIIGA